MLIGTGSTNRHCEGDAPKGIDADGFDAAIVAMSPWLYCAGMFLIVVPLNAGKPLKYSKPEPTACNAFFSTNV